jgi:hypothetical protein
MKEREERQMLQKQTLLAQLFQTFSNPTLHQTLMFQNVCRALVWSLLWDWKLYLPHQQWQLHQFHLHRHSQLHHHHQKNFFNNSVLISSDMSFKKTRLILCLKMNSYLVGNKQLIAW